MYLLSIFFLSGTNSGGVKQGTHWIWNKLDGETNQDPKADNQFLMEFRNHENVRREIDEGVQTRNKIKQNSLFDKIVNLSPTKG